MWKEKKTRQRERMRDKKNRRKGQRISLKGYQAHEMASQGRNRRFEDRWCRESIKKK